MKSLQEKVQAMLDGETKRRETAVKFLNEVTETLVPVAKDIWGGNYHQGENQNAVWISQQGKDNKREYTDFYFRYEEHEGNQRWEREDFYFSNTGLPYWGKHIEDLKGAEFWGAIRIIIDWIPYVAELMESRSISREELLSKINL